MRQTVTSQYILMTSALRKTSVEASLSSYTTILSDCLPTFLRATSLSLVCLPGESSPGRCYFSMLFPQRYANRSFAFSFFSNEMMVRGICVKIEEFRDFDNLDKK